MAHGILHCDNVYWSRNWRPTPVFLPGEPHGQKSLAEHSPWGHNESDVTERLNNDVHGKQVLKKWIYMCMDNSLTLLYT